MVRQRQGGALTLRAGRTARAPEGKDGVTVSHTGVDVTPKSARLRSMGVPFVTHSRGLLIQSSCAFESNVWKINRA